jgi:drug/metabolite transporter (DMT)-like permease
MTRAFAQCLLAAVLFGLSAPAASRLTADMGAVTLAGLLYVGAGLAVLPLVLRSPPTRVDVRRSMPKLAPAVLLGGAIGPVLLTAGLAYVPAASASLLLNLELVFTTLVAGLLFHEHIGRAVTIGTLWVVAGGVVLSWSGQPEARWGALLIAGACLCWAFDNSLTATLDRLSPSAITLAKGGVAGVSNVAIGLSLDGGLPSTGSTLAALAVGAVGYGASITLWVAGARQLGAARGQLVFATAPFIGAIGAWLLGDGITGREAVAFACGVVGVSFVLRSAHEHRHHHHAVTHTHEHVHDDMHHAHTHDAAVAADVRHTHEHHHDAVEHLHPHVPDIHHRHVH